MARTPESVVKADVKKFLKERGAWYFLPVSNGMGSMGVPDVIACHNGRFIGIECKAPGRERNTSALQDRQIMGIHKAGGIAVVVSDVSQLEGIFV